MKKRYLLSLFVLASVFGSVRATAQPLQPETLRISVQHGEVLVEADGITFAPRELNALRGAVRGRLADTPFREQGAIALTLRGQAVRTLKAKLGSVDLTDSEALERVLDDVSEEYGIGSRGDSGSVLTEPMKVIIGQAFTLTADSRAASLLVIGSHGVVDGHLSELVAIGSDIRLSPSAAVSNNLVSIGSSLDIDPSAHITAQEAVISLPEPGAFFSQWTAPRRDSSVAWGAHLTWALVTFLLSLGFGALYVHLFPHVHAQALERLTEQPWRAFGYGTLHYLAIFPGALVLVFTIIGVLLLPVYFMAVGLILWAAYVTSAVWIGKNLLQTSPTWKQLALGLGLLKLAGLLPVVGLIVALALTAFGLGCLAQTVYRVGRRSTPTDQTSMAQPHPA